MQLVLQRVWDVERERRSNVLRLTTLTELGGAQRIVEDHLERAMAALTPAQQQVAAGMFDHLVTPSGTKIAHAVTDLASFAHVEEHQLKPVLASLARERILRATGDNTAAGDRYEIYHDVLAGAVLSWKADHEAEVALEHERAAARRRQRRLAIVAGTLLAGVAAMAALAIYAFSQRSTARHQATVARLEQAKAVKAEGTAQELQRLAVEAGYEVPQPQRSIPEDRRHRAPPPRRGTGPDLQARCGKTPSSRTRIASSATRNSCSCSGGTSSRARTGSCGRKPSRSRTRRRKGDLRTRQQVAATRHATAEELLQRAQAEVVNDPLQSVGDSLAALALERLPQVEDVLRSSLLATHELATLPAGGPAIQAAYSPDGTRIAVVTTNGRLRVYSVPAGRLVRDLHAGAGLTSIAWSPDGGEILVGGSNGTAELWNVAAGTVMRTLAHGSPVLNVAFSPTGAVVATSGGKVTKLWDPRSGGLLHTLPHDGRLVRSASFSDNGSLLLTVANQNVARIWDVATGTLVQALQQRTTINTAAFGPGGALVATGSQDGTAKIWDVHTGVTLETLTGHTASIRSIAFSRTGDRVATASTDGTLRVWSTTTGLLDVVRGFTSALVSVAFSPDGQSEIGVEGDGRAITAGVSQLQMALVGQPGPARMGVFAPNGSTAATVGGTSVWLWEPYGEPRLRGIHVHAAPATAVTFDPTGTLLASADSGGTVVVQKAHGGPVRSFTTGSGIVALSWAQDGHLLAAGKNGSLQLRTGDGAQVSRAFSHGGPITAAALRADGATLASADVDGTVRLWRTSSGTELLTLHAGAPVGAVALDPTGKLVAVGAGDDVLVFSATTGSKVETLTGHTDTVTGVAFSPDGLKLASSSRDHDARLWLTDGFRLLQVLHRHTAFVSGVAFSSDGRWLATAGALKAGVWSASQQSDLPGSFLLFARGNAAPLSSVAWSPRGWELATASRDGSVRVVDCTLCGAVAQLERVAKVLRARLHA